MTKKKTLALLLALVLLALAALLAYTAAGRIARQLYPLEYSETVDACAEAYGLDPLLIYAFIRTESGFDAAATSNVGARGLMQITEETCAWIQSKLAPGVPMDYDSMYDGDTCIRYGSYYLDACLARYGEDIATAAAAYHSGWGTVDTLLQKPQYSADGAVLSDFPYANMNRYVEKIARSYACYQRLYPHYPDIG